MRLTSLWVPGSEDRGDVCFLPVLGTHLGHQDLSEIIGSSLTRMSAASLGTRERVLPGPTELWCPSCAGVLSCSPVMTEVKKAWSTLAPAPVSSWLTLSLVFLLLLMHL